MNKSIMVYQARIGDAFISMELESLNNWKVMIIVDFCLWKLNTRFFRMNEQEISKNTCSILFRFFVFM